MEETIFSVIGFDEENNRCIYGTYSSQENALDMCNLLRESGLDESHKLSIIQTTLNEMCVVANVD